MIISGDIGGTKTNLALFKDQEGQYVSIYAATFKSQDYPNLVSIVSEFYEQCKQHIDVAQIEAAAFAIAGPVEGDICRATNLPWIVEAKNLAKALHIEQVYLLNDLEANAYALEILPEKSLLALYKPKGKALGNRAVISPGTGLGEAGLYFDGVRHHPFACEGGHCEFGPRNALEIQLSQYLIKTFGHPSYERILSGPGIHNLYIFFRDVVKLEEPKWLADEMTQKDPSYVISEHALEGDVEICTKTLDLFVAIFGSEASNCVLKFMATGGLYIGGGISPKILPKLQEAAFLEGFFDKGRFRGIMEKVPITLVIDDKAALLGACHYCRLQTKSVVSH